MSGDYSRFVFNPKRDYDGVLLQQGRALTDWDWNDDVAQRQRRAQATAHDTFGGQAVVPLTTPQGFALSVDGDGMLQIGPGRIYVDGLLAENHGLQTSGASQAWDAALAELAGTQPVPFDQQPYLPGAVLPTSGGPYLAYLDVWQREVTQYQAPDLLEPALGGPDTTARLQTVWQLKLLAPAGDAALSCDTDPATIADWAPSAGRLSSDTADYGQPTPCLIPPSGGYTGLENQLYRVEIHDGGTPGAGGTATFKWSRDNASVETRVAQFIDTTHLLVDSVGKDAVLRFNDGDWIEVLDDVLELGGKPGELRRIAIGGGVDDATRTITLDQPLTGFAPGTPDDWRHTRIRRWDQQGVVLRTDTATPSTYADLDAAGSSGAIRVPDSGTVTLALENGIVVRFSLDPAGGKYHSGDYWTFAARSATADVDKLDRAPPQGIHHHYAKLGIYAPGQQPSDCRVFWPPAQTAGDGCACTVCVSAAEQSQHPDALQQAIDTVIKRGGGTVCLEAGDYPLRDTLRIADAGQLTLRGQGLASRLIAKSAAIDIGNCEQVWLEDFAIDCSLTRQRDSSGAAAILIAGAGRDRYDTRTACRLRRVDIAVSAKSKAAAILLRSDQTSATQFVLRDCTLAAPFGVVGDGSVAGSARIEDNRFDCSLGAVELHPLNTSRWPLRIAGNIVAGAAQYGLSVQAPPRAADAAGAPTHLSDVIIIAAHAQPDGGIDILGNQISVAGDGIRAVVPGLRIADNDIRYQPGSGSSPDEPVGIRLSADGSDTTDAVGSALLGGNRISGFPYAAILSQLRLAGLTVSGNQIRATGLGIVAGGCTQLSITDNQLAELSGYTSAATANEPAVTNGYGIVALRATQLSIAGNIIAGVCSAAGKNALEAGGILAQSSELTEIRGNQLSDIAASRNFDGTAFGIYVRTRFGEVRIADNQVRRDAASTDADAAKWIALRIEDPDLASESYTLVAGSVAAPAASKTSKRARAAKTAKTASPAASAPTTIEMTEMPQSLTAAPQMRALSHLDYGAAVAAPAASSDSSPLRVGVRGNVLDARGAAPAVYVRTGQDCDFSGNQCRRDTAASERQTVADIELAGRTLIVHGNRVSGSVLAMQLQLPASNNKALPLSVVGNITLGEILLFGQSPPTLPSPWDALNIRGL